MQNKLINIGKFVLISCAAVTCVELLAADDNSAPETLSGIADNLRGQFAAIGNLILATARVAGIGFAVAAIFKFKQHKDNPTQVPIGTPFALLAVGVVLMFMKALFDPAAKSVYGSGASFDGFDNMGASGDSSTSP